MPPLSSSPPLPQLTTTSLPGAQGECLTAFSAYKEMLGIKAVSWSPSGQLLAVGDFEQARGEGNRRCREAGAGLSGGPAHEGMRCSCLLTAAD